MRTSGIVIPATIAALLQSAGAQAAGPAQLAASDALFQRSGIEAAARLAAPVTAATRTTETVVVKTPATIGGIARPPLEPSAGVPIKSVVAANGPAPQATQNASAQIQYCQ